MSTVKSLMGRSHPSFTSGKPKFGASKVSMPKKAFVKEHKELVKTLKTGSKSARIEEANEQANELRRVWKKK